MNLLEKFKTYADVESDVSLKSKTTFRIGGLCKYYVYPKSFFGFMEIMRLCKENDLKVKILGKGSNVLCSDQYYDGVIINFDRHLNNYYFEEEAVLVEAGCSVILLAMEASKLGLSGLEFASGIPATIGGCLFMNAGAYKSNMSEVVEQVYVYKDHRIEVMDVSTLQYGYRTSIFQKNLDWVILGAKIKLKKGDREEITKLMKTRKERRISSQPLDKPSAGSVFRNPDGQAAWQLIENAGLRGKMIGGAKVSDKHANFIVNEQEAKAQDVIDLIELIQKEVKQQFDVELHAEVEKFNWI